MTDFACRIEPHQWYPIARLREVWAEIVQKARNDSELSNAVRVPSGSKYPWLKQWREEQVPFTILANRLGWPDCDQFLWRDDRHASTNNHPPRDFDVKALGESFGVECTTAHPEWPAEHAVGEKPGDTRVKGMMHLNVEGWAWTGGNPARPPSVGWDEEKQVYNLPWTSEVAKQAWQHGISTALHGKLDNKYRGQKLLIFAEGAAIHASVDFNFAEVAAAAYEIYRSRLQDIFESIYVLDTAEHTFFRTQNG